MTRSSRHRTRNLRPGGLRPNTLPLGHGGSPRYWILTSERGETFCSFETRIPKQGTSPRSPTFQADSFRGFVKLKKSKNPRKTRKWVGGSSPNSDYFLFFWNFVFLCVFFVRLSKKLDRVVGWLWSGQSDFFSDFWIFFNLTRPLNHYTRAFDKHLV